ncbi:MAG: 5'-methylthioadenosine/adenosylhomocysteine nucleosidase [Lachnospiraceae bacterium]|nr:5'-methylthioadenosine/adenosylhomocysteine nucleosidase [Lachnospiraceae bacterium]MBQ4304658.1 5'-methylthioadenosine/adenosylhomocysteine nucleosidase [Lachnospiraceae bacterium]MBQ5360103.1 5'-methylthioadenosine/adenosylhomocysteine nucleosidase [Lachnospiraceae bacterium]
MKIGIIGAMDVEVSSLKKAMKIDRTVTKAGMEFCEGTLGRVPVVVVKCGIGKVNAGMCVQILADLFDVTHVLNTGIAGSLNNDINIGDIVVSTDAVYHDMDVTFMGYQPGEVPGMGFVSFKADEELRREAVRACREAAPDIQVFEGRIASGDQFIGERAVKDRIRSVFSGDCTEMEGCAIAQAAYLNRLPFIIIRAISDKADESVTVSYEEFEGRAAEHCAGLVRYMIEHM